MIILHLAGAVPRFALENGASCNLCHVNPTGGGMRNDYGATLYSLDDLPRITSTNLGKGHWDGVINEHLKIGGEFRVQSLVHEDTEGKLTVPIFPMQADLTTLVTASENVSVYGNIRLAGGILNEFWAMASGLPNDTWVRIGRILPDYGLKVDDHTAFIRGGNIRQTHGLSKEGLFFTPAVLPAGIEAGTRLGNGIRLTGSVTNGFILGSEPSYGFNESISDKAVSVKISLVKSFLEVVHTMGSLSAIRESDAASAGLSGGVSVGKLTWQFEIDRAYEYPDTSTAQALYQEFTFTPVQGISLTGRYEFFDPDLDYANGSILRIVAGVELFPQYGLQTILQIRFTRTENIPVDPPKPEFLCQLHYWF